MAKYEVTISETREGKDGDGTPRTDRVEVYSQEFDQVDVSAIARFLNQEKSN